MNIYKATIGTHTAKGKFQEHASIIVKSELGLEEVQSHFYRQYKGLTTNVVEVTENVVEIKEEGAAGVKKTVKMSDYEIKQSVVSANYGKMYSLDDYPTLQDYTAIMAADDLPGWVEFDNKRASLRKSLEELDLDYEKLVKESLHEIKSFDLFKILSNGVKFKFKPSKFNFELKAIVTGGAKVDDLPF